MNIGDKVNIIGAKLYQEIAPDYYTLDAIYENHYVIGLHYKKYTYQRSICKCDKHKIVTY